MSAKRGSLGKVQERKVVKKKKVKQIKDMKNGRKGGGSGNGTLSLLKKGGIGSNNSTTTTSCNNTLLPAFEDKDRRMLVKRRVSVSWHMQVLGDDVTMLFCDFVGTWKLMEDPD